MNFIFTFGENPRVLGLKTRRKPGVPTDSDLKFLGDPEKVKPGMAHF